MKNNKKGFTLIELLAVIAILAILVVIAVPAVLDLFNSSKVSAFKTQAQTLLKATEQQIITDSLANVTSKSIYSNIPAVTGTEVSALTLNGGSAVSYYFEVDVATSKVTCMIIYNDTSSIIKKNPLVSDLTNISLGAGSTYTGATKASLATACTTAP